MVERQQDLLKGELQSSVKSSRVLLHTRAAVCMSTCVLVTVYILHLCTCEGMDCCLYVLVCIRERLYFLSFSYWYYGVFRSTKAE